MKLKEKEVNILSALIENEMIYVENCINEETDEKYLMELKEQLQELAEIKKKILKK